MSYKGKINVYKCQSGHETVTIDKDEGTTPFMIACKTCSELSRSSFYQVPQTLTPVYEWYKPESESKLSPGEAQHVRMGGLLLRKIPEVKESKS